MSVETPYLTAYPSIYVRLRGRNGAVREYKALVDITAEYCVIPRVDAYRLGYPEAAHDDPITTPANLVRLATINGYTEGMMIVIQQVSIGKIMVENVPFLGLDLPQVMGFDVILGRTFFLKGFLDVELDFSRAKLKISQIPEEPKKQ